jgi:hypothetical protein
VTWAKEDVVDALEDVVDALDLEEGAVIRRSLEAVCPR